jgi:DNA-binding transcriptional MocR family regulator
MLICEHSGCTKSGGAPSQLTSTFITHMLQNGTLQNHIETTLLPAYSKRYHAMAKALDDHLAELGFQVQRPKDFFGGYFVWVKIPSSLQHSDLVGECLKQENVIVASGKVFQVPGETSRTFENYIRLCFAFEDISNFTEGIKRIAHVARSLIQNIDGRDSEHLATRVDASLDVTK